MRRGLRKRVCTQRRRSDRRRDKRQARPQGGPNAFGALRVERSAVLEFRKRISWYAKNLHPCKRMREEMRLMNGAAEFEAMTYIEYVPAEKPVSVTVVAFAARSVAFENAPPFVEM